MPKDSKRELTKAERDRLSLFKQTAAETKALGFKQNTLTVSVVQANVGGILYGVALSVPLIAGFVLCNRASFSGGGLDLGEDFFSAYLTFMVVLIVLIVVHELIHGLTWSLFTKGHFAAIEFGVIWKMLTPYCTCKEPLSRSHYLAGLFMPCFVLGIIPSVLAWMSGNAWLLITGIIMVFGAGGDLLMGQMILKNRVRNEALYLDHPTEVGVVIFEKAQ